MIKNIYGLTLDEVTTELQSLGLKSFRTLQIWQGIYQNHWLQWDQFTNISKDTRSLLSEHFYLMQIKIIRQLKSQDDQTHKVLFQLQDGKTIEAVLMKYKTRNTLCLSTQVGCAMNCEFCATGQMGFFRNLTTDEIVQQVLFFSDWLRNEEETLTNVVYMGMGEPFNNYDAVMKSITILNDHQGFDFGQRRITISTVGLVPQIDQFTKEDCQVNLAISLHATNDELRNQLIPVNRRYPLSKLMASCRNYAQSTRRRISFEYALMEGINDSPQDAENLARLLHGMLCHVNLIPLNATEGSKFHGTSPETTENFKQILDLHHIPASIRLRRGLDIAAGCGQLATDPSKGLGYN